MPAAAARCCRRTFRASATRCGENAPMSSCSMSTDSGWSSTFARKSASSLMPEIARASFGRVHAVYILLRIGLNRSACTCTFAWSLPCKAQQPSGKPDVACVHNCAHLVLIDCCDVCVPRRHPNQLYPAKRRSQVDPRDLLLYPRLRVFQRRARHL